MTAVQQYWIVENDVNLVSSITPVPVADEAGIAGIASLFTIQLDSTPLDGWAGGVDSTLTLTITTISQPEYDNLYDSADKWKGSPAIASIVVATSGFQQYSNPYDAVDKWKGAINGLASITVTTIVITYDNLYDTSDKWKGSPAIASITVT